MNFEFTAEQELLKKAARELAEEVIAPQVEEMEKTKELPEDFYPILAEAGFTGILVPEEYGGSNLGTLAAILVVEEISRISAALGTSFQVHCLGYVPLVRLGSPELKAKYLPGVAAGEYIATGAITEASGGSDPTGGMTTTAVRDGDDWIINGRKCFISNNKTANCTWLTAVTNDQPKKEFTTFFVDKSMEGYKTGRMESKTGFHGLDNGDLIFQNCRVPHSHIILGEGKGITVAMTSIGRMGRMGMAAVGLGVIKASLDAAVKFANERVLYGKPIAHLQGVQFKIAEMTYLLEASRLLVYRAAWMTDQNVPDKDLAPYVAMAKSYATDAAIKASDLAVEILGGYGVVEEYHVERYLRDARMIWAAAGTGDIMRLTVARMSLNG
ncbi:MAG: acyl-CoA dehydrogenase family protein [Bacillota bacterium]|jgi:alkylation response protein AidB-like acyl-CoA dehydrogenase